MSEEVREGLADHPFWLEWKKKAEKWNELQKNYALKDQSKHGFKMAYWIATHDIEDLERLVGILERHEEALNIVYEMEGLPMPDVVHEYRFRLKKILEGRGLTKRGKVND